GAELHAGRPVLVRENSEAILALPVAGARAERVEAFQALFQPARPHLVITARRARSLGLDATEPVLLALTAADDADSILALAADHSVERGIVASVAGPAGGRGGGHGERLGETPPPPGGGGGRRGGLC